VARTNYYGIIGNGETVALIGPDLSISWLSVPAIDSSPLFAQGLDPVRGGFLKISTDVPPAGLEQHYVERSNILVTSGRWQGLMLRVDDFMPWGKSCLVRRLAFTNRCGEEKAPLLRLEIKPVASRHIPWKLEQLNNGLIAVWSSQVVLVAGIPGLPAFDCDFQLEPLQPRETREYRLVLAWGADLAQALEAWEDGLVSQESETELFWKDWLAQSYQPDVQSQEIFEAYQRSLLTLKLLTYEPTGAIVAAATASFPATPGGTDNWDYRYVWLRDGYYVAMAYDDAGLFDEAARFYNFVCFLQEEDGSWPQPLYTVNGGIPVEMIIDDLAGPGGEKPVRLGNEAAYQLQLDNVGNIIHGIWHHYCRSNDLDFLEARWVNVLRSARWLMANWSKPEQGIWEIRERMDHWVHGKVMCLVALKSAAEIGAILGYHDLAKQWLEVQQTIKKQVLDLGFNHDRGAFLRHYGPDAPLDASVLALCLYDVLSATDPRMRATAAQIQLEVERGGLNFAGGICRFEGAVLPFYLTTFWLGRYYLKLGDFSKAEEILKVCLAASTSLGLMSEHFNPATGQQYGNFPQAFSHEELVRMVIELEYEMQNQFRVYNIS